MDFAVVLHVEMAGSPRGWDAVLALRTRLPFAPTAGVLIAPFTDGDLTWKVEEVSYDLRSNSFEVFLGEEDWSADLVQKLVATGWQIEGAPDA